MALSLTLRDYQQAALGRVRAAILERGVKRVCVVSPTGSGKTVTGVSWLVGHPGLRGLPLLHDDTGLWIVHRRELLRQSRDAIAGILGSLDVGIIAPGEDRRPHARVQVATIQSLMASGERPAVGRIVIDECHHLPAQQLWSTVLHAYPDTPVVGLTATPERQDGQPLGDVFTELLVAARYPDLVAAGHLVDCQAYAPSADAAGGLARDPLDAYLELGLGERAFLFTTRVDFAERFAERFTAAGVPACAISERTPKRDRDRYLAEFGAGNIRVLTNVYTLTEGVDVPAARVCILARRFNSEGPYLQCAGRVLRPAPGKPDAIIIDLAGSVLRYGLPTEDRVYSLDGRAIRRATPSLRQCPECGAVYPGSPTSCERCGFVWPPPAPPKPPRIYDIALKRVFAGSATPGDAKQREWERLRALCLERGWSLEWAVRQYQKLFPNELPELSLDDRRSIYDGLVRLQQERGFKPMFAAARYHALLGVWPPRAWAATSAAPQEHA